MRSILITILAFLLASCGHVPLTSLPKLRNLDIMTVDAGALRVAVVMPQGLRVREGSAVIVAGLNPSVAGPSVEETFVLEDVSATENTGALPQTAQIFRISESDLPRLEAFRTTVRQRRKEHPDDTGGQLTVTSGGCRTAALPAGPLPVDTLLRTERDGGYFVLTRGVDLRRLTRNADLTTQIPLCD